MEENTALSYEDFKTIIGAVGTSDVLVTDKEGIIRYVNPTWQKETGWKAEEVVGKVTPRILKSGRQNKEFYGKMWQTIIAGSVFKAEIVNKRKDGTLYHVQIELFPIRTSKNGTMFVEISRNIVGEATLERQKREFQEKQILELNILVGEKTKELEAKIKELEEFNKLMVGRELKIAELKKENQELKKKLEII